MKEAWESWGENKSQRRSNWLKIWIHSQATHLSISRRCECYGLKMFASNVYSKYSLSYVYTGKTTEKPGWVIKTKVKKKSVQISVTAHNRRERFYSLNPGKFKRKEKRKSSEKWNRITVVIIYYLKHPAFNQKLSDIQGNRKVWSIFRKKQQSIEIDSTWAQRPPDSSYKCVQKWKEIMFNYFF